MVTHATLRMPISDSEMQELPRPHSRIATIITKLHAAKNLDELFLDLKHELVSLFHVEQLTLYAVDNQKKELYSRYLLDTLDGVQEIRVPINDTSVSGYCARHGTILNIAD